PVPEILEVLAEEDLLADLNRATLVSVLDFKSAGSLAEDLLDLVLLPFESLWNHDRALLERLAKCILHLALGIKVALGLEVFPQRLGLLYPKRCDRAIRLLDDDPSKLVLLDDAEADARVL